MPQAPTQPTTSSFFPSLQPAKETIQKPRKRVPLALLELNGVKINSYPTASTPQKNAWVKVTPERITLESPPVVFGSSLPLPTRTPLGFVKRPAPGKENRPPSGLREGWSSSKSLKKGLLFGYDIEVSDIVSDEELVNDSEDFGFGLVCRGVGKIYCDDEHESVTTTSEMVSNPTDGLLTIEERRSNLGLPINGSIPSMMNGVEYLRKEHSTPLGRREGLSRNTTLTMVTSVLSSPPGFESNSCPAFSGVSIPAGHDGVPSDPPYLLPELDTTKNLNIPCPSITLRSTREATSTTSIQTEKDLVSQTRQPRPDDKIPIYKLISPAGICLPLHPTPRPPRNPSQHQPSKIPSSLESTRDIVRFTRIVVPAASPFPVVEVVGKETSAPPESRIPIPQLQRKVLPLPKSRAGRNFGKSGNRETPGVSTRTAVAQELPPPVVGSGSGGVVLHKYPPKCVVEENGKLGCASSNDTASIRLIRSATSSGISRQPPKPEAPPVSPITVSKTNSPDQFDPYLELYTQNSHPHLYRRLSTSHPQQPKPSRGLQRCTSMPVQTSTSNTATRRREGWKKKKAAPLAPVRKLFDMRPPPPTPEEDKNLDYYGSRYDWWRGMRV
jgi:hypothetical protein